MVYDDRNLECEAVNPPMGLIALAFYEAVTSYWTQRERLKLGNMDTKEFTENFRELHLLPPGW